MISCDIIAKEIKQLKPKISELLQSNLQNDSYTTLSKIHDTIMDVILLRNCTTGVQNQLCYVYWIDNDDNKFRIVPYEVQHQETDVLYRDDVIKAISRQLNEPIPEHATIVGLIPIIEKG